MASSVDSLYLEKKMVAYEPLLAAAGSNDSKKDNASDGEACTPEPLTDFHRRRGQNRRSRNYYLRVTFQALVVAFALFGVLNVVGAVVGIPLPVESVESRSCNCGNSSEEIEALGCRFDGIAAAFLPPHCRDHALLAEFDRSGDDDSDGSWIYWADPEKTLRLNETGMMRVALDRGWFWASQKYHIVHCTFNWRKQWRAMLARQGKGNGRGAAEKVEKRFLNEDHIKHCGEIDQMSNPLDKLSTQSGIALNADL